jgi:hypothetical protein
VILNKQYLRRHILHPLLLKVPRIGQLGSFYVKLLLVEKPEQQQILIAAPKKLTLRRP